MRGTQVGKFNSVQTNFKSGEIGERSLGRVDTKDYFQGCELMDNFIPIAGGGVSKRKGFTNMSSTNAKLLGLVGTQQIRTYPFEKDGVNYVVVINAGAATVDLAFSVYRVEVTSGKQNLTSMSVISALAARGFHTSAGQLVNFREFVQLNDYLIICDSSGTYMPICLVLVPESTNYFAVHPFIDCPRRFSDNGGGGLTDSPRDASDFQKFPYELANINTNLRMRPSATTGIITITCENAAGAAQSYFTTDNANSYIKITHGAVTGVAFLTSFVSSSVMNAIVVVTFGATTRSDNWQESSWGQKRGYPKAIASLEGRLVFGGSRVNRDAVWMSRTDNPFFFMQDRLVQDATTNVSGLFYFGAAQATDPFSFFLAGDLPAEITAMKSEKFLVVGTKRGLYIVSSGSEGLSAQTVISRKNSSNGVNEMLLIKNSIFAISDDRRAIIEFRYNDNAGGYQTVNLSELNMDIIDAENPLILENYNTISGLCFSPSNDSLYCITADARIIGLTVSNAEDSRAFHRITIAKGEAYSVLCLGRTTTTMGGMYVGARNTDTSDYDLLFMPMVDDGRDLVKTSGLSRVWGNHYFFDWGLALNDTGALSVVANPYYSNVLYTLDVTIDAVYTLVADSSNLGALSVAGKKYYSNGRLFTAKIKSVPLEQQSMFGSGFPTIKRIDRLIFRLFRSSNFKMGDSDTDLDIVVLDPATGKYFTGLSDQEHLDIQYGEDNHFYIVKDTPGPLNILAIGIRGQLND
jgi:hypothetical protein